MHFHTEQVLKIFDQASMVQQAAARLPRDQQVEVAVLIRFATRDRPKHTQTMSTALLGEAQDFVPPFCSQCV